ncbi:hypothetical protein PAMA_011824 [Pampus argenteus]
MDPGEAEVATRSEGSKDTVPSTSDVSSQGEDGPKSNKASLKRRNSDKDTNHKAKKRKKARVKRSAQPSYTVHEGEDMLLVISSSTSQYDGSTWAPKKKGSKKKKPSLTAQAFQSLGLHSRSLQSINLQYSEVEGLLEYLENHGSQIRQILFTHGLKNDRLLTAVTRGYCPDLEFLEVNTKLDSKECEFPVCIQALQIACPKLKIFRMLNVRPLHKTMRNGAELTSGFPLLEELCIATTSYSYMTDKDLLDILFGSTKLRVLDLRGCSRITPAGLATLPCLELECLFWGQYFSSHIGLSSPKKGLHMVTQKWNQTLQQLDIANQLFSEEDLEMAMSHLAQATDADTLRSLNLSGTRITPPALRFGVSRCRSRDITQKQCCVCTTFCRSVIGQLTALSYLNLSSCRYLPRGMKRVYRGQEDIRQLLDKLE